MEIPILHNFSWNLKKILHLRVDVSRLIQLPDGSWGRLQSRFKAAIVYEELRQKCTKVDWHRLVWFKHHIPTSMH